MKKILAVGAIAVVAASMCHVGQAEARRFGGGMSFGHYRAIPHASSHTYAAGSSLGRRAGAIPHRGFMGAIAGLAMGGLIGALLFGGPFQGIDLLDILVIGGILLLVLGMLRRKAESMAYAGHQFPGAHMPRYGFNGTAAQAPAGAAPAIDRERFLASAKEIFVRMQASWDAKDIADIRRFCTPEIASRIEADMTSLGEGRALTEVATLAAELADSWMESGYEWAAVRFDAMLREQSLDASGALSEDLSHAVSEFWIFRHDPRIDDPTWYLAGIQQAA